MHVYVLCVCVSAWKGIVVHVCVCAFVCALFLTPSHALTLSRRFLSSPNGLTMLKETTFIQQELESWRRHEFIE